MRKLLYLFTSISLLWMTSCEEMTPWDEAAAVNCLLTDVDNEIYFYAYDISNPTVFEEGTVNIPELYTYNDMEQLTKVRIYDGEGSSAVINFEYEGDRIVEANSGTPGVAFWSIVFVYEGDRIVEAVETYTENVPSSNLKVIKANSIRRVMNMQREKRAKLNVSNGRIAEEYVEIGKYVFDYNENGDISTIATFFGEADRFVSAGTYDLTYDEIGNLIELSSTGEGYYWSDRYTYDDMINPFVKTYPSPVISLLVMEETISAHNTLTYDEYISVDDQEFSSVTEYAYEYNEDRLPTLQTTTYTEEEEGVQVEVTSNRIFYYDCE
ncbi:hypothetical protein [Algivirga pacifica]|uniref:DUF4595 domain-containing protein n=1 Tax=Algivirga pacifica TaxID=1162670 RepID=A0ABP9DHE1_9BACT